MSDNEFKKVEVPEAKGTPGFARVTAWTIAEDLAKLTNLGVDEAHDVIAGIIKKRGRRLQ